MIGLYLGCNAKTLNQSQLEFQELHESYQFTDIHGIRGEVIFHGDTEGYHYQQDEENKARVYVSGWILYKDKLNDISGLFNDLNHHAEDALLNITGGVFVALFVSEDKTFLFNDPMGLSNHYYTLRNDKLYLTPTLTAFERSDLTLDPDPKFVQILDKLGHLFGNHTKYVDVYRMEPGSILYNDAAVKKYADVLSSAPISLEKIVNRFSSIIEQFPESKRQLPLSGGMDSRLILSAAKFSFGYCYGPANSGDRPIARQYAREFNNFIEFEFSQAIKQGNEKAIYAEICETPPEMIKSEFLASYRQVATQSNGANIIFDGFLGDTLQRGVRMHVGGLLGELYRFFPILYSVRGFSAHEIFKRRYNNLSSSEFDMLFEDFTQRTSDLDIDDYAKVTYYEFIWGRGARFINNGALLINGQYGQIVPIFADPITFSSLIKQDFLRTVRFKTLCDIWQGVAQKFKQVKFENGYKISTPNIIKPKIALVWRLLARYVPGFGNYGNS
ncbi:hypothetical protein [Thalassotalea fusca]